MGYTHPRRRDGGWGRSLRFGCRRRCYGCHPRSRNARHDPPISQCASSPSHCHWAELSRGAHYSALSDALVGFSSYAMQGKSKSDSELGVVVHECARLYGVQIVRNMGAEAIVGANSEHVGRLRSVGAAEVWELSMERLLSASTNSLWCTTQWG